MYGAACVQSTRSSVGDREDIVVTHRIIIIKSEKSIFRCHIFLGLCVCDVSHSLSFISFPGKLGIVSITTRMRANNHLHYVHLSKNIEYVRCWSCIFCRVRVYKIKSVPSITFIQCMGLCVFSSPISRDDCDKGRTLSYYPHQNGSMNQQPLLSITSWNGGMRCMCWYVLIKYHYIL